MEPSLSRETSYFTRQLETKPNTDLNEARKLIRNLYGLTVKSISELNAYDDKNFHVLCQKESDNPYIPQVHDPGYVLKITNSLDSRRTRVLEAQNEILIYLNENGITCPLPAKNSSGSYYSLETLSNSSEKYAVRLLLYRPGSIVIQVPLTRTLLLNIGLFAIRLDKVLEGFKDSTYDDHQHLWMLTNVPKIREFIHALEDPEKRDLMNVVITEFEKRVLDRIDEFDKGMIHGDLNTQNMVVNPEGSDVAAVLDFGDVQRSCLLFELVVALCYTILQAKDINVGRYVLMGYESERRLTDLEKRVLKISVCARLCQSLAIGIYTHSRDPQNDYVLISQNSGWTILNELWPMDEADVLEVWGLTTC